MYLMKIMCPRVCLDIYIMLLDATLPLSVASIQARSLILLCVVCGWGIALKSIINTRQSFGTDVWIGRFKLCIWDHFINHSFYSPSDLFFKKHSKNCISMSKKVIRCFPSFLLVILKKTKVFFWCHCPTFQEKHRGNLPFDPSPPRFA